MAGAAVTGRLCRRLPGEPRPRRPTAVRHWLAVEAVLLAATTAGWAAAGGAPGRPWRDVVLVALALAMGVQSAALASAGRTGRPGTYFTGTLTTLAIGAVSPGDVLRLAALTAGAAAAAVVRAAAPAWAIAVPLACALVALLCVPAPRRK